MKLHSQLNYSFFGSSFAVASSPYRRNHQHQHHHHHQHHQTGFPIGISQFLTHRSFFFHHTFISLHLAFVHYPLASNCFGGLGGWPEQVVIVPWSPELCMLRHLFKMRVPLVVPELSLLRNLVHVANMRLMPYPYNACLGRGWAPPPTPQVLPI